MLSTSPRMPGDCSGSMGEDCGTWEPQRRLDWRSPNLSSFRVPCERKQTGVSAYLNPDVDNMVTSNEAMPAYASSVLPHLQLGCTNESPHGWFYCLPRFRQAFMPAPNFSAEGNIPAGQVEELGGETVLNRETQKQFLVIDQTVDQTTFIYSPPLDSWHSKHHGPNYLNVNELPFKRDVNDLIGSSFPAKVDENQEREVESEMHEDTEEINALLYSDSDDCSAADEDEDEDEITSTGHSPSTMTTHDDGGEIFRAATEEVGTSTGKSKKRKLSDCAYDDTASSLNVKGPNEQEGEDDAAWRCSCGKSQGSGEMVYLSGNKKMRKEKVREVLSFLQTVVPGGKDKDPVVLLDEAIRYLKSLKLKARALGLDALLSS